VLADIKNTAAKIIDRGGPIKMPPPGGAVSTNPKLLL